MFGRATITLGIDPHSSNATVLAYHVCNSRSGATYISKFWSLNHFQAAHAFTDDANQLIFLCTGVDCYIWQSKEGERMTTFRSARYPLHLQWSSFV